MTKEIIIDGVDVSKCCWCDFEPNTEPYCRINDGEDLDCESNLNCNFKQLKRKEQECEELKKEINGYKTIIEKIRQEVQEDATCWSRKCDCDSYEECIECLKNTILDIIYEERNDFVQGRVICKECGKYKKALDEIEEFCIVYSNNHDAYKTVYKHILDIINKAKENK